MSLSKAALNMAEALRPVLVKLIPQKMLSAVKAKSSKKVQKTLKKQRLHHLSRRHTKGHQPDWQHQKRYGIGTEYAPGR